MKVLVILLSFLTVSLNLDAQDLLKERIWKISSRKRAIFLDKGVFHSPKNTIQQQLVNIRNSYVKARGYERIVFDFSGIKPPQVYGMLGQGSKIYLDLFNTTMPNQVRTPKHVKYLKNIDFYPIDSSDLSLELSFEKGVSFDIFYLEKPGRLVIDVKK